jgi:hypothetical protein
LFEPLSFAAAAAFESALWASFWMEILPSFLAFFVWYQLVAWASESKTAMGGANKAKLEVKPTKETWKLLRN